MVVTDAGERVPYKRAVFQINQEWRIAIQTIAQIYSSCHLVVEGWGQSARCGTNTRFWNLTHIILPHLLGKKVESFIHLHSTNISYIYTYMKDKEVSFGQVRKAKKFWEG